jgi:hypothetical protein
MSDCYDRPVLLVAQVGEQKHCFIRSIFEPCRLRHQDFQSAFYIAPLFILEGAPGGHYLTAFNPEQLQAIALLFLKLNDGGAGMALAFFGFEALLNGYLVFRSTFLPRILGILSMIAGLGWLTFLYPFLGYRMFFYVEPFALLGSAAMIFWLIVFGVNEERWRERASAAGI